MCDIRRFPVVLRDPGRDRRTEHIAAWPRRGSPFHPPTALIPFGVLTGLGLWTLTGCGLSAPGRPEASINGGATRQGLGLAPSGHTRSTDLTVNGGGRTRTAHGHVSRPDATIGRPAGHRPIGAFSGTASGYSGRLGWRSGLLGAGPAGSGTGTTIPNRLGSGATGRNAGVAFGTQGGGVPQTSLSPSASGPTGRRLAHTGLPARPAAGPLPSGAGRPVITRPMTGTPSPVAAGPGINAPVTGKRVSGTGPPTGRGTLSGRAGSPYANPGTRAAYDRTGGAHRAHMGVYHPPQGHRTGRPLSRPVSLAHLPLWSRLVPLNGYLVSYVRLTPWVANMGYHYGHKGPGLILMRSRTQEVVGVETGFPASKGWEPWYDQSRGRPAGVIYSEHLYFVPPLEITPTMPANLTADLTRWSNFQAVNRTRTETYTAIGPDPSGRATMEGPKGFGIRVLVAKTGQVVGLLAAWPSSDPQGWRPWFDQPNGKPITDPLLGSVYTQHLWLADPRSLPLV